MTVDIPVPAAPPMPRRAGASPTPNHHIDACVGFADQCGLAVVVQGSSVQVGKRVALGVTHSEPGGP